MLPSKMLSTSKAGGAKAPMDKLSLCLTVKHYFFFFYFQFQSELPLLPLVPIASFSFAVHLPVSLGKLNLDTGFQEAASGGSNTGE